MTPKQFIEHAESFIDSASLVDAVEALGEICLHKAEHARVNWQDDELASLWEKKAKVMQRAEAALDKLRGKVR